MNELRVLLIEDSETDAMLLLRQLRQGGYTPVHQRVDSADGMRGALKDGIWDVIFSDHNLPGFSSLGALNVLKESGLDIPFIIVSAMIGEEAAVEAMRAGAHDYLMKDRLARLVPTVQREIREAKSRTVKRQAEEALAVSEARFRFMADNAPVMIWMTDEHHVLSYTNKPWQDFTGMTPDMEATQDWIQCIHPDDQASTHEAFQAAVQQQLPINLEYRLKRQDGEYRWVLNRGTPLMGSHQRFQGYIGSIIDITDRKHAERALEIYTQKLESSNRELEEFAMVASHDLQAPLRKVNIFADYLRSSLGESASEETLDYIARIQKSARTMQQLVSDLLALSRVTRNDGKFSRVCFERILKSVLDDLEAEITDRSAQIVLDVPETPVWFEGDATQLKQLLQNLFENSLKFQRPNIPPVIRVQVQRVSKDRVELTVQDNGIGIKQEYRDKIFQVFQRLHGNSLYPGNGIGLAIVKKIVERHSGQITLDGTPNEGTTFIITLPISQSAYVDALARFRGPQNPATCGS